MADRGDPRCRPGHLVAFMGVRSLKVGEIATLMRPTEGDVNVRAERGVNRIAVGADAFQVRRQDIGLALDVSTSSTTISRVTAIGSDGGFMSLGRGSLRVLKGTAAER